MGDNLRAAIVTGTTNTEFFLTLIVVVICGVAWGQAGFPRFTEVAMSAGFCLALAVGLLWLAKRA